jgi:hypothetical protein
MDSNELVKQSRARFDHEAARRNLREKYQARLIFAHSGGMFRASPEMMVFLNLYQDQTIVVEDLYHNPVQVAATDLLEQMRMRWQEQMTAWLVEYDRINQQR